MSIPDGYVVENQLGENNSNNDFDSSSVTANADGSVFERLEAIKDQISAVTTAQVLVKGVCDAAMVASTTTVVSDDLAGYGDDFFNNQFYMQILHNDNNATNAPEKQTRKITDYVSATGTFTVDAFSANVEASDIILIIHESAVAIGSDNADNVYSSTNVAANADGSVLERLEDIKDKIVAVDDYVDSEITSLQTSVDNFSNAGGEGKAIVRKTVTFANTAADVNLFTVTGGISYKLYAFCTTNVESAGGCNIGVDHNSVVVIADTACTDLEANDIWHDASPDASVELESVAAKRIGYGGPILLDVEAGKQVDSGVITFVCIYTPLTSDGAVAAA